MHRTPYRVITLIVSLALGVGFSAFAQALPQPATLPVQQPVVNLAQPPAVSSSAPLTLSLVEPYIAISPDTYYPLEEVLYLEGRADPNALVTVVFEFQGEKPIKFTVKADSSGEWVVAEKTFLTTGNWQVRARQQVGLVVSGWSNPRVIRVIVTGVSLFGVNVRYVVLAGIGFIIFAIIVAIFVYFRRKIANLQRGLMEKQLRETEDRFHRGFAEIRKDLMDQLRDLAANSQSRPLTPEEVEKRDHILRELEEMEKNLEHDVGDIGRRI